MKAKLGSKRKFKEYYLRTYSKVNHQTHKKMNLLTNSKENYRKYSKLNRWAYYKMNLSNISQQFKIIELTIQID